LQEGDVGGQAAEGGQMHGDTLQLQRDGPHQFSLSRDRRATERFHGGAMAPSVGHTTVTTNRLDGAGQRERWALRQHGFDAAVLVAQLNLQMVDTLTQAHEAKVPWLNHAGVNRAHTDFVHFLAAHLEEGVVRHLLLARALKPHRLEPRVPQRHDAGLLPQFTLKNLGLGVAWCQRRVAHARVGTGSQHAPIAFRILQHGGDDPRCIAVGPPQQAEQACARLKLARTVLGQRGQGQHLLRVQVKQLYRFTLPHQRPPIDSATTTSKRLSGSGV
jgi:hypothetical protein